MGAGSSSPPFFPEKGKTQMDKIKVKARTFHTFGGNAYNEGDVYEVKGDATQTAAQYVNTMAVLGFVGQPDDEDDSKSNDSKKSKKYETRELKAKK